MNRLRCTLLLLSLPALFVPLHAAAIAEETASPESVKAKIRALQQERVDVLQRAVEFALKAYREGRMDFRTVHATQHDLVDAKLDMAETREERIELLASQLKIAQSALKFAEARFQAGQTTALDVHQAKSTALRIRIQLLKLQQVGATKKPE